MYLSDKWEDYRIVDASGGEKLEYWGDILLRRPDPQAIWTEKTEKKRDKLIYISMGTVNNDMMPFYKACISTFAKHF